MSKIITCLTFGYLFDECFHYLEVCSVVLRKYIMLGKWFSAQDAHKMGLVNRVVPKDKLMETALDLADEVCNVIAFTFEYICDVSFYAIDMSTK